MSLEIWTTEFASTTLGKVPVPPKETLDDGMELLAPHHAWLSAGTLLGLYRDNGFIPHDTDLDVGMLGDWDNPIDPMDVVQPFTEEGFMHIRRMSYDGRVMQLAFVKRVTIFDIYFFYINKEEDIAINYNDNGVMRKPQHFVSNLGSMIFLGDKYPTPWPIEDYLEYRYRDWRTPTGGKRPWFEDAAPGLLQPS